MKTEITILDLLYSGWWWVTCILGAGFEIFVLNNKGGGDGTCYLSLVEFIVFRLLLLQPVQTMQPSSQSVQYPAVSYPPQHLLPVSPTQQFSVVLKISYLFFFPWTWRCEYVCSRASGEHCNRCPTWESCLNISSPLCFGTGKHFEHTHWFWLPNLKGDVTAGLSTCLADPPEKYFVVPAGSLCLLT